MINSTQKIFPTSFYEDGKSYTLTVYQCRKDKNVALISSFYEKVIINTENENFFQTQLIVITILK